MSEAGLIEDMINNEDQQLFVEEELLLLKEEYSLLQEKRSLLREERSLLKKKMTFLEKKITMLEDDKQEDDKQLPSREEKKPDLGFIILRCVRSKDHDLLWQECYDHIRKLYPNPILIIDDNSNPSFLTQDKPLENVTIVKSEYPGAGELLPYYYFLQLNPFERAIILHDSMFIKRPIEIPTGQQIRFLWHFETHVWDDKKTETDYLKQLSTNPDLISFYESKKWYGCFGVASVVSHDYVKMLDQKYNLFILKDLIKTRDQRSSLERVMAVIAFFERSVDLHNCSYYGNIFHFPRAFRVNYQQYKASPFEQPMIKVWSGR
jgi:hypothetical protein